MAIRPHIKCPVCGTQRLLVKYGISDAGHEPVEYETGLSIQTIGGRASARWTHEALPLNLAKLLREQLKHALDKLDADIAAAETD